MKTVRSLLIALSILSAVPLAAHDMWIEPTSFVPDAGAVIGLRLRVGQNFLGALDGLFPHATQHLGHFGHALGGAERLHLGNGPVAVDQLFHAQVLVAIAGQLGQVGDA